MQNDEDTSFAGVHDKDTSLAGVHVPKTTIMTNDETLDAESDHNSIDPNEDDNNSSKASAHSTGSHLSIHSTTIEPTQHPLDEEHPPNEEDILSKDQTNLDDKELPELETLVPVLHQSKRVSVPPSNYIPWMGGKKYVMNVQTKTKQDNDERNSLVYNRDKARVMATVITTFNECMECIVEEHRQQHVVTYSLMAGINKFGN